MESEGKVRFFSIQCSYCSVLGEPLMVAQWLRYSATNRKVAGWIPDVSLEFFIDIILPIALWPWG
jgi:hypothetical protein